MKDMCQLVHTRGDYQDASGKIGKKISHSTYFLVKDFDFSVISETDIEKSKVLAEKNAPKVAEAKQAKKVKEQKRVQKYEEERRLEKIIEDEKKEKLRQDNLAWRKAFEKEEEAAYRKSGFHF